MTRACRTEDAYYPGNGDPTLVSKLKRIRWAVCLLPCIGFLTLPFLDSDILDLKRLSMSAGWLVPIPILQVLLTFCVYAYLSAILKYLCLYKPSPAVGSLNSAARQERYGSIDAMTTFIGGLAGGGIVVAAVVPHLFIWRRPDYHFFGFILPKFALFVVIMQVGLLIKTRLELQAAITEWRELHESYSTLSFPTYAHCYDGHEESILPQ